MFAHSEKILVMLLHSPMEVCAAKYMWLFHKKQISMEKGMYHSDMYLVGKGSSMSSGKVGIQELGELPL
jgi:hypothetical protein